MTEPVQRVMTKAELREALPDVAAFVDLVRAVFGDGVRVKGIRTAEFTIGRPEVVPGIRLSQCVWDSPAEPVVESNPAAQASRKRRRA
jgi:hypothetical protein